MTQVQVAEGCSTSKDQISRWERGEVTPDADHLFDWVKCLDGDVSVVARLWRSKHATVQDGELFARTLIRRELLNQE